MSQDVRPLHVNIPLDLKQRFDKIPWGVRTHVVRKLIEWACILYEKHGELGLGAILAEKFELTSDAIVDRPKTGQAVRTGAHRGKD